MLDNVSGRIKPVMRLSAQTHHEMGLIPSYSPIIKDLATQEMSTDAPAVGPAFFLKIVVAHRLRVHVVNLKAGVVWSTFFDWLWRRLYEEALSNLSC